MKNSRPSSQFLTTFIKLRPITTSSKRPMDENHRGTGQKVFTELTLNFKGSGIDKDGNKIAYGE